MFAHVDDMAVEVPETTAKEDILSLYEVQSRV